MELQLIPGNDPLLRLPSQPFDFSSPQCNSWDLAAALEKVMNYFDGFGLSAIQCGMPLRVFCMRTKPDVTMFNPRLIDVSEQTVTLEEGCLSFPNLTMKVTRPRIIKVRYTLKDGDTRTTKLDGMTARCFLHEMDHLDGKLFFAEASKLKVEMAAKKAGKLGTIYKAKELMEMTK